MHEARPWEHEAIDYDYRCYVDCNMVPSSYYDSSLYGKHTPPLAGVHLEAYKDKWGRTTYTEILH